MRTKNILPALMMFGSAIMLLSCGSGEKEKATEPAASGSEFLKEDKPAYDPKAIDTNAPVIELTLKALGNTMDEMKFDQAELKVKAGSTVKLTLINTSKDSSMQHNFVLIDKDAMQKVADEALKAGVDNQFVPTIDEVFIASKLTMPGEIISITFAAPPAGEYKFVCTYPGHVSKMNGRFVVE